MNLRPTFQKLGEYKDKNGKTLELWFEFASTVHVNDYDLYLKKDYRMIQIGHGVRFTNWKIDKLIKFLANHDPLFQVWYRWHSP